jgi:hypothetical protein
MGVWELDRPVLGFAFAGYVEDPHLDAFLAFLAFRALVKIFGFHAPIGIFTLSNLVFLLSWTGSISKVVQPIIT